MPDGILPLSHSLVYISISFVIIIIAIIQSRKSLTLKQIPIVGVLAAGLFAAQMFNFPVPFGSSGHIIGTALATALLGPWVAILMLSAILIIQAFFGDGGFLAFGANALNMAIIGAFSTVLFFLIIPKKWRMKKELFAVFAGLAGFLSTMMMAFGASVQLSIAQIGSPGLIFGWMFAIHAIIGLVEGLATFALVIFTFKADASLFEKAEDSLFMRAKTSPEENSIPKYKFPVWAAVSTVVVFGAMSLFGIVASENPDGLERTFEFLEESGVNLQIQDSGLFGFPEGLGWSILQMAIIMLLIFVVIVGISLLVFFVQKRKFSKNNKEDSLNDIEIEESGENEVELDSSTIEECTN